MQNPNKNKLVFIRYVGNNLDLTVLPIFELGNSLIAIQRIIHKIHLYKENRLEKYAKPSFKKTSTCFANFGQKKEFRRTSTIE